MSATSHYTRLARLADERCIPLSVTLELGLGCNLHCVHCYNFDRSLTHHPDGTRGDELSDAEICRVISEVRAEGALFLAFTGGEPMSHPRLQEFVAQAAQTGLLVRLKSNGTLMTPERAATLFRCGLRAVDVSVYGASVATHDAFVRQPGAFLRTVAGVRAAKSAGIQVRLSFVLSTGNAEEVTAMIELAGALEVPYGLDTHVTARHDGSRSSLQLALDRPAFERLYRGPLAPLVVAPRPPEARIACPCARSVCGIGSCGDVFPCIGAPLPAGNLREKSFREIWRESPTLIWVRRLENEDFKACAGCAHTGYCRRTSGVMLNNTGIFNGPERFGDTSCCVEAEVVHALAHAHAAG